MWKINGSRPIDREVPMAMRGDCKRFSAPVDIFVQALEARMLLSAGGSPLVQESILSTTLPSEFVSGDKATARIQITNDGDGVAKGVVNVQLSLVPGNGASAVPITLSGNGDIPIQLNAGKSKLVTLGFTVPSIGIEFALDAPSYLLTAVLSAVKGFAANTVSSTPATESTPQTNVAE